MKIILAGACLMLMGVVAYGQDVPSIPPQTTPQTQFIPRDMLKEDVSSVASSSNLTIEQLYTLINERDRQYQQRFESQEKAVNAALIAAKEAVNAALSAAQTAVNKAEVANEKRLDNQNEFRGQLKDQAAMLMPRSEADIRFKSIESAIAQHSDVLARSGGQFSGVQWIIGVIGAAIGGLFTMIALGLQYRIANKPVK